jgi:hypothetical protein
MTFCSISLKQRSPDNAVVGEGGVLGAKFSKSGFPLELLERIS